MGRKRILFIGESVSLAHISRPLFLAESLDPEEYEVHFACGGNYEAFLSDHPFHYWSLQGIKTDDFLNSQKTGGFIPSEKEIEAYVTQELRLYEEINPSLIISDLRFSVSISAEISQIPYATLANVHWSPYRDLGYDPVPPSIKQSQNKIRSSSKKPPSATEIFNAVRMRYKLPKFIDYCDLATHGDYTFYTEPPGFIPTKNMPDNHFFIGPILWEPKVQKPSWWNCWDTDTPIIYITLGSTGAAESLAEIIESLEALHATLLVSTAGRIHFEKLPKNVYTADYLPGLETCDLASVVVCNGGSATTYQAMSKGTAVLGIWSNIDQYLTIMNVERNGAGISIQANDLDVQQITSKVKILLEESNYSRSARDIRTMFDKYESRKIFNKLLQKIIE